MNILKRLVLAMSSAASLMSCSNSEPRVTGNIEVRVIPHNSQRYNTVGDYWIDRAGTRQIRISALGDPAMEQLILVHELVELSLNQKAGITDDVVDEFDFAYEARRRPGDESEPGDDPRAPYYAHHQFANRIERQLADELQVDWEEYERRIIQVSNTYSR